MNVNFQKSVVVTERANLTEFVSITIMEHKTILGIVEYPSQVFRKKNGAYTFQSRTTDTTMPSVWLMNGYRRVYGFRADGSTAELTF